MVSLLFICLAAICNAIMDTLSHHYPVSIFKYKDKQWWDPSVSWRNKYNLGKVYLGRRKFNGLIIPVFLTDAWHLFKQLMIVFIFLSIVTFENICVNDIFGFVVILLIYGFSWWAFFTLFYKRILRR